MKRENLIEVLERMKPGSDVVISKAMVMSADGEVVGILDVPIIGIAENKDEPEIRFVLDYEDVKKCFKPSEVVPIPPSMFREENGG